MKKTSLLLTAFTAVAFIASTPVFAQDSAPTPTPAHKHKHKKKTTTNSSSDTSGSTGSSDGK